MARGDALQHWDVLRVSDKFEYAKTYKFDREQDGVRVARVSGVCWFTNMEHGRRHEPLQLMTMADNIKFSKHKEMRGVGYQRYDNFDAIEVPYVDAIPSDCDGVDGRPDHVPRQVQPRSVRDRREAWTTSEPAGRRREADR